MPKLPKLSAREAGMEHNFSSAPRGPDFAECAALPSESEQHPVPGAVRICLEGAETLLQWTKNYLFLVHGPDFNYAFSVGISSTRHLHNFPSGRDVFDVNTCAEASDTINVFEGNRLSNLVLGSCSVVGIFALLLTVLVTSLNEKRKRQ